MRRFLTIFLICFSSFSYASTCTWLANQISSDISKYSTSLGSKRLPWMNFSWLKKQLGDAEVERVSPTLNQYKWVCPEDNDSYIAVVVDHSGRVSNIDGIYSSESGSGTLSACLSCFPEWSLQQEQLQESMVVRDEPVRDELIPSKETIVRPYEIKNSKIVVKPIVKPVVKPVEKSIVKPVEKPLLPVIKPMYESTTSIKPKEKPFVPKKIELQSDTTAIPVIKPILDAKGLAKPVIQPAPKLIIPKPAGIAKVDTAVKADVKTKPDTTVKAVVKAALPKPQLIIKPVAELQAPKLMPPAAAAQTALVKPAVNQPVSQPVSEPKPKMMPAAPAPQEIKPVATVPQPPAEPQQKMMPEAPVSEIKPVALATTPVKHEASTHESQPGKFIFPLKPVAEPMLPTQRLKSPEMPKKVKPAEADKTKIVAAETKDVTEETKVVTTETKVETKTETKPEVKVEPKAEVKVEPKPEIKSENKPEPSVESKQEIAKTSAPVVTPAPPKKLACGDVMSQIEDIAQKGSGAPETYVWEDLEWLKKNFGPVDMQRNNNISGYEWKCNGESVMYFIKDGQIIYGATTCIKDNCTISYASRVSGNMKGFSVKLPSKPGK